jgi:hypothetical protein
MATAKPVALDQIGANAWLRSRFLNPNAHGKYLFFIFQF